VGLEKVTYLPYMLLFKTVPYLWRHYWLSRGFLFISLAGVVMAALAVGPLVDRFVRPRWGRNLAIVLLCILPGVESALHFNVPFPAAVNYPYRSELARETSEYLAGLSDDPDAGAVITYSAHDTSLYMQTIHQRPILCSGVWGLAPYAMTPELYKLVGDNAVVKALAKDYLRDEQEPLPKEDFIRLAQLGYDKIIIHLDFVRYANGTVPCDSDTLEPVCIPDSLQFMLYFVRYSSGIVPCGEGSIEPACTDRLSAYLATGLARRLEENLGPPTQHGLVLVYEFPDVPVACTECR